MLFFQTRMVQFFLPLWVPSTLIFWFFWDDVHLFAIFHLLWAERFDSFTLTNKITDFVNLVSINTNIFIIKLSRLCWVLNWFLLSLLLVIVTVLVYSIIVSPLVATSSPCISVPLKRLRTVSSTLTDAPNSTARWIRPLSVIAISSLLSESHPLILSWIVLIALLIRVGERQILVRLRNFSWWIEWVLKHHLA